MEVISTLQAHPLLFDIYVLVVGLLVGSFLNVVIYRVPISMEREFLAECKAALAAQDNSEPPSAVQAPQNPDDEQPFNIFVPRSHCPSCKTTIKAWQNIPVVSYLIQKGKCAHCGAPISIRYPIIESISGAISVFIAIQFGVTTECLAALLIFWSLLALTVIDYDHYLLPDSITLPFLWLGIFFSMNGWGFVSLQDSVTGAIAGYLSLWTVYWLFKIITKKEGMGFGDFKLLAMLGAWLGWKMLPVIVILSSLVGAVVGISLILFAGRDRNKHIPFGPYLAAAGFLCVFWGDTILDYYLHNLV